MMDLIECSLCIRWCSLGLFERSFEGKLGGRAIIGFSGVGVRVTKGGYQILLGDCHTITIPSDSISQKKSIGEVEGRTFKQSRLEVRYSPTDGLLSTLPILVAPRPSTLPSTSFDCQKDKNRAVSTLY